MNLEGYERVDRSVSIVFANVVGFAAMPVMIVAMYGVWKAVGPAHVDTSPAALVAWVVFSLVSMLLHEVLHVVGYVLAGAQWGEVRIGFMWRLLTPYATCSRPLRKSGYVLASALPGLVLGAVPLPFALLLGSPGGYAYAGFMLVGAIGDALAIFAIRDLPNDTFVLDHASRAGCIAFVRRA